MSYYLTSKHHGICRKTDALINGTELRAQKENHVYMGRQFFTKETKTHNEENKTFSIKSAEKIENHLQRMKLD